MSRVFDQKDPGHPCRLSDGQPTVVGRDAGAVLANAMFARRRRASPRRRGTDRTAFKRSGHRNLVRASRKRRYAVATAVRFLTMTDATLAPNLQFHLGAQIPPVPPNETASLLGVRELSAGEASQLEADELLVRSLARTAPYQRAAKAYEQLFEVAKKAQTTADHRPTARAAAGLSDGLSAVAHAFRTLPDALKQTLLTNLPEDTESEQWFTAAVDAMTEQMPYRLAVQLDTLASEQLLVLREDPGVELVATSETVASWADAAALEEVPDALGVLVTVEEALEDTARLVAQWLHAQRETVDAACRRISSLDGEVFQGASCLLELTPGDDGASLEITNFHPLPVHDVATVQYAIARSEALLDTTDRAPATRGPRAMTSETLEAIATPRRVGSSAALPAAETSEPSARDRPMDMRAVIDHLQLGALRLEQAWSRALEQRDVATLAGEWASLQQALIGELQYLDDTIPEDERQLDLPPTIDEILALLADEDDPGDRRLRVAQVVAISDLVALIPALHEPTIALSAGTAQRVAWFSSGAFANVREQLALVAALLAERGAEETALAAKRLASRARVRADPLAEVIHLARALSEVPPGQLPAAGTPERAVIEQLHDLARRIATGEPVAAAQATLAALAARTVLDRLSAR